MLSIVCIDAYVCKHVHVCDFELYKYIKNIHLKCVLKSIIVIKSICGDVGKGMGVYECILLASALPQI